MRIILFILCSLLCQLSFAQNWRFGAEAGVSFGAPIPTQFNPDSSRGTPSVGLALGGSVSRKIGQKWWLRSGIYIQQKGASYGQTYQRDTLVKFELIPGVMDSIPTFYTGDVNGRMRLWYAMIPVEAEWQFTKRMSVGLGLYAGYQFARLDTGSVHIVIGEGGFFDDEIQHFQNHKKMHRWELGASLSGRYRTDFGMTIGLSLYRDLYRLYHHEFFTSRGFEDNPLYLTYAMLTLGYEWKR